MWACDPALTSTIVNSYQVAGPLFTRALQTFFAAQCTIAGDHLWPADAEEAVLKDPNYDFIVIGAGSAGSVVANRLSEIPDWKVLLVEAGGDPTVATETPQLFFNNLETAEDWGYKTQPQASACRSYKTRGCSWPRGKVLGGSSSINGMYYVRGNKVDYDEWAAAGNKGWSYEEVLPYFKKSEKFFGELNEENEKYHNYEGYLNVDFNRKMDEYEDMIVQAGVELGLKNLSDVNGASQMGIIKSATTIKDGLRYSTARSFLSPVKDRKNLDVIKYAYAKKILFKLGTNVVSGILVNKNGKDIIINVKKELIISGGTINSAQLLLLSGIGPRKHLEDLDIELKADLPVGENLQDHLYVPVTFTSPSEKKYIDLPQIVQAFTEYILTQGGSWADTSPQRIISFMNITYPDAVSPDIQNHYLVYEPGSYNLLDMMNKHGLSEEVQRKFRKMNKDKLVLMVVNVLLRPISKGKLFLKSKNPQDYPLLYANYFDDPDDMKTIIRSIKQYTLKLDKTKALKDNGFKLDWIELEACKNYSKESDQFLECISREMTFSLYHPTGTVKMGRDDDVTAVVDPELKVRKVKGLRVIDASIMPVIVRGNTNAPTIMIGEKGADMIKKYWLKRHTEL